MESRLTLQPQDQSVKKDNYRDDYVVIYSPDNWLKLQNEVEESNQKLARFAELNEGLIKQLIKTRECVNKQGEHIIKLQVEVERLKNRNPFHDMLIAHAKAGNLLAATKLVEICGTAEVCDEEGITALHWSILHNHVEMAEYLAANGAKWEMRNARQETIFTMLSRMPNEKSLIMVIKHYPAAELCAELEKAYDLFTEPPFNTYIARQFLMHVCKLNQLAYLESALAKNENVNFTDGAGNNPLHYACLASNVTCVSRLLEKNANTDAKDASNKKPDDLTSNNEIKCLINQYRLFQAIREGDEEKVHEWLPLPDTDINAIRDRSGMSPMHLAVQSREIPIVGELLRKGMCSYIKNNEGKTPIHLAVEQEEKQMLRVVMIGAASLKKKDIKALCQQTKDYNLGMLPLYYFGKQHSIFGELQEKSHHNLDDKMSNSSQENIQQSINKC